MRLSAARAESCLPSPVQHMLIVCHGGQKYLRYLCCSPPLSGTPPLPLVPPQPRPEIPAWSAQIPEALMPRRTPQLGERTWQRSDLAPPPMET